MIRAKLTFHLNENAMLCVAEKVLQQMADNGCRPVTVPSLQQLHNALDAYRDALSNDKKSLAKAKVLQAIKQWYLQSAIAVQQNNMKSIKDNPRTKIENGLPPTPL